GTFSFTLKRVREAGKSFKCGFIRVSQEFALNRKNCLQDTTRRLQLASVHQQLAERVQIPEHIGVRVTQKLSPDHEGLGVQRLRFLELFHRIQRPSEVFQR